MSGHCAASVEMTRMEALIRHCVGWQVDNLHIFRSEEGLVIRGHATCGRARALVAEEAARLSGLPIVNEIEVN